MRVLPGVVKQGRRRLAGACLILAGAAALTGCAQFDKALGQREAVVSFRSGTPVSQRLTVRSTCAKIPAVDIIDFSYTHWHRLTDVPENCSGDSLEQVARVLGVWVQRVK